MEPWVGHGINHATVTCGSLESGGQGLRRCSTGVLELVADEGGHTLLKG